MNWGSILKKIQSSESCKVKLAEEETIAAAEFFAEELRSQVWMMPAGNEFRVSIGSPSKINDTTYSISVSIPKVYRPSVDPGSYPGGVDDLYTLLDEGYQASGTVYGLWHGNYISTRPSFGGYHTADAAISSSIGASDGIYTIQNITKG